MTFHYNEGPGSQSLVIFARGAGVKCTARQVDVSVRLTTSAEAPKVTALFRCDHERYQPCRARGPGISSIDSAYTADHSERDAIGSKENQRERAEFEGGG
jgi:hypothetical protein